MKTHEYKYGLALTSQFYFCGIPFRLDTTPKCSLDCLYCFAMARGGRRTSRRLVIDPQSVERKLARVFEKNVVNDVASEMIQHRTPVHFGGISDPFSNQLATSRSRRLLSILNRYDYPVILSTKNTCALLRENVIELLKEMKHVAIQISLGTCNRRFASKVEPSAPTPGERIRSIHTLSREGIYCMCRVQPLFYSQITNVVEELIPRLAQAQCKHVMVEYLKLPVECNISGSHKMLRQIKWDAYRFYKQHGAILVGREWLLPAQFKWENLQSIITSIHKFGMTYGAADYGLHHMGDTCCCCGIDEINGFGNWFKSNFAAVIRNSTGTMVKFPRVSREWFPERSIKRILNSNCRVKGHSQGIFAYLKEKWNAPGTPNAPDSFLGVRWTGTRDRNRNCVYVREE